MKSRLKQLLTFFIGWPLSIIALYFILKTFLPKYDQIEHSLQNTNYFLLGIGIVCFFMYYLVRSVVWLRLLKNMGYEFPYHKIVFLWASSEFKRYIPGNIWSFVGRTVLFTEKGMTKKDIGKALVFEQEIVLLGCIFASVISFPFIINEMFPYLKQIPFINVLPFLIIILGAAAYIYMPFFTQNLPTKIQQIIHHILPKFVPIETFIMLSLSSLAFLFFGLGYYFSITAIFPLNPQLVFVLAGFFIFSLLVGLLSFLTPTGLGVREGVMTVGLSKVIPIAKAGFASVAGRIVLVSSEVVFLLFSYAIHKIPEKTAVVYEQFIKHHIYQILLMIGVLLFTIYFTIISFLRYENFNTGRFDLGNMDQTVWNTRHGRIFQLTNPDGIEIVSRLAFHADFILILFAPLYFIWEDPRILLFSQAIIVGSGAIFVFLLANTVLKNKLLSLVFAFSYLLNPSVQRTVLYDFHAVTLATTFLLGSFYFLYKRRLIWFIIFSLLAAITKEQIWIIVGFLGFYLFNIEFLKQKPITNMLRNKSALLGLFVAFLSFLAFYILFWYAIPAASNSKHFALSYFKEDNNNMSDLVVNTILSPNNLFKKLSDHDRQDYIKQLLLPVGFLPIAAPIYVLFPIADLILNVLSDKPELHQIYYQYTAAITPFLFISSIFAIHFINKYVSKITLRVFTLYVAIFSLYGAFLYGPLPSAKSPNLAMITQPLEDREYISENLLQIHPALKVAATNSLGSHLAHREHLYTLPKGINEADVLIFQLTDNQNQPSKLWHEEKVRELRSSDDYEILFEKDHIVAFQRK